MAIVTKLYEQYTRDKIFELSERAREPLVEGMLYRNDYIMLVARAKVGKTIFMQQLTACMTSGTSFLTAHNIPKPLNVWYFATEGRTDDLKERFIRVDSKYKIDTNRLSLFKTFFAFNSQEGIKCLEEIIENNLDNKPDVIIIDALYRGFKGSLKDDQDTNRFNNVMSQLIDRLDCSIIVVHHLKKPSKDEKGNNMKQDEQDSYGSTFFDANLDHKFHLEKWRDKDYPLDRVLKCKLQRSGNIVDNVRMRLHQPNPLYFEMVTKNLEGKNKVLKVLQTSAVDLNMDDLIERTKIGRSTLFKIVRSLEDDKFIERTVSGRHVMYTFIGNSSEDGY